MPPTPRPAREKTRTRLSGTVAVLGLTVFRLPPSSCLQVDPADRLAKREERSLRQGPQNCRSTARVRAPCQIRNQISSNGRSVLIPILTLTSRLALGAEFDKDAISNGCAKGTQSQCRVDEDNRRVPFRGACSSPFSTRGEHNKTNQRPAW